MNITAAQTELKNAEAIYAPIARRLHNFRYNLSISKAANKAAKAALAADEARAFRAVRIASLALLAARQEARG